MFTKDQEKLAADVTGHYAARRLAGERRCFPLELHDATFRCVVPTIVEGIIVDGAGRYALVPRPERDEVYGGGRLHILGGASNPGTRSMLADAEWMAQTEFGFDNLSYVAGPIAVYTWQVEDNHPFGTPRSEVYVFKAEGKWPENNGVRWFLNGTFPTNDELIIGRFGQMHRRFLQVYHSAIVASSTLRCVDLNLSP